MKTSNEYTGLEIAVIGMACRCPGARTIREYWENIKNGVETVTFFPDEELEQAGVAKEHLRNPNYVKAMGYLPGIEEFDAGFFDYPPLEAEVMDPQIRLFHESAWEALEDAGIVPETSDALIGLYAGASDSFYWKSLSVVSGRMEELGQFELDKLANKDYLCGRVAYKLNLKGPVVFVHTACSTSLAAIHIAVQALLSGETDIALAGGVSIIPYKGGYIYQEGMIQSPDGHTRTFDDSAGGTVAACGLGIVVLKRLEEALADNDHIYALVKGSAMNNDGTQKMGWTAPSVEGQYAAIKDALQTAQVEPETISYVEAHGTGTALGDPVEIEALTLAYQTRKKAWCGIGTVKSNFGHLDTAAGVAGFIKATLALHHRLIPPTLFFETPNRNIDFINTPFYVNNQLTEWNNEKGTTPRRAGVSSLGLGGTNVHVVLEEAPAPVKTSSINTSEPQLIILSAKTSTALQRMKENLAAHLAKNPGINLAEVAYTLQTGRKAFSYRWQALCSTPDETTAALTATVPPQEDIKLTRLAQTWLEGQDIDWRQEIWAEAPPPRRIPLPTYPFERQRYWLEGDPFKLSVEKFSKKNRIEKEPDMARWFYVPSWKRAALPHQSHQPENSAAAGHPERWLVFVDDMGIGSRVVEKLKASNHDVTVVRQGKNVNRDQVRQTGQAEDYTNYTIYTINPGGRGEYDRLFKELSYAAKLPNKILHLWSLDRETANNNNDVSGDEAFAAIQTRGFYSVLFLVKALQKQRFREEIQLDVVTANAQNVTGHDLLHPESATLLGLARVIPQENPFILCRSIDIELPESEAAQTAPLLEEEAEQLVSECNSTSLEPTVAIRGRYRWIQAYEPHPLETPTSPAPRLKKRGVYLVTGGFGSIGNIIAQILARQVHARLVLIGRTPVTPSSRERTSGKQTIQIRQLEELGAEVLALDADVADFTQMAEVLRQAKIRFGPIDGIFHAAGDTGSSMACTIEQLEETQVRSQFHARVHGLRTLADLLAHVEKKPGFILVVSSLVTVLGGIGFAAYAAAIMFMDAWVHYRNRKGGPPWFSMNTAEWLFNKEGTSSAIAPVEVAALAMSIAEGKETIERILAHCHENQVIVSTANLDARIAKWVRLEALRKDRKDRPGKTGGAIGAISLHPRPQLSTPYIPPANSLQETLVEVWQHFFSISPVGIHDDFFQLGGDSLKVITLLSKIHNEFAVKISIEDFFKKPTIENLALQLRSGDREVEPPTEDHHRILYPTENREYYPLSSAQQRLYLLQQMNPANTGYNIILVLPLTGDIEKNRFEKAFEQLLHRHESLRTSFPEIGEQPVQRIHDHVEFKIEYYSILATEGTADTEGTEGTNSTHERNRKLNEQSGTGHCPIRNLISNFIRPFDLTRAPLLRAGLFAQPEGGTILAIDMHHIISDGKSQTNLIEEIDALYHGDHGETLPPLPLQYKDFSQWQNRLFASGGLKAQEEYWLNLFRQPGDIPRLELPADFERPEIFTFAGDNYGIRLKAEEVTPLRELAAKAGGTLFMNLLAVLNTLFYKYTGQEDMIIGSGTAGRPHPGMHRIIGMFIDTLPLRNFPQGEKTYTEFLKEVIASSIKAFDHQDLRFEELVNRLDLTRDPSRNPLFQVSMVLQNFQPRGQLVEENLEILEMAYQNSTARFDMTFFVHELGEEVYIDIEYYTAIFKRERIQRLESHLRQLLHTLSSQPGLHLKDIDILTPEERNRILYDFNATAGAYPSDKTIPELYAEQTRRTPDRTALATSIPAPLPGTGNEKRDEESSDFRFFTYNEIDQRAHDMALQLKEKGIAPGDIVGLMIERSLDMIISLLAILKAGAAYLPISPNYPEERINYILSDSGAKIMVTPETFSLLPVLDWINRSNRSYISYKQPCSTLAYIIYTSGTTGRPKGVMINHRGVARLVKNTNYIEFNARDRLLQTGALEFDISTFEIWGPLLNGARLCQEKDETVLDLERIGKALIKHDITILHLIPQLFNRYAQQGPGIFKRLTYLLVGGDLVRPRYIDIIRKAHPGLKILHMYGPTENTTFSSYYPVTAPVETSLPIGKPLANSMIFILGKNNEFMPVGIPGEICTAGDGTARGYLNNPELTAEKFLATDEHRRTQITFNKSFCGGPGGDFFKKSPLAVGDIIYKTGDLGRWQPQGNIEFLGRKDHQVKIRGVRIEPAEIENLLLKNKEIKEAVVVPLKEGPETENLCAYITATRTFTTPELKEILTGHLPNFMVPAFFIQLEKFPLSSTGKIDRNALPKTLPHTSEQYTAPRNKIEEVLTKIWTEVLTPGTGESPTPRRPIGIDDNFFSLGGHSLNAVVVISKIHKALEVKIPLAEIFRHQTVKTLAEYITHIARTASETYTAYTAYTAIRPVEKKEYYPLSSAQQRVYFIQEMDRGGIAYNMPLFVTFRELNIDKLQTVFNKLLARHDSLRTSFIKVEETPVQRIHDHVEFKIETYNNLAAEGTGGTGERDCGFTEPVGTGHGPVRNLVSNFLRPFDLSQAPLLRAGVLSYPEGSHILMLDMHHIISDGTSQSILSREFAAVYNDDNDDNDDNVDNVDNVELAAPLPLQYKDFTHWQNLLLASGEIAAQEKYWLKLYSDAPDLSPLELPTDYKRPEIFTFTGNRYGFAINKDESILNKEGDTGGDGTLFMNMLALLNVLFYKTTGREDIIIGSAIAGRRHADLQPVIGMFVNTLVMRNHPGGEKKVDAFRREVINTSIEALENQDVQFEHLVEKLAIKRDAARNPLFDVCMVVQNFQPAGRASENTLPAANLAKEFKPTTAKFDLTFFIFETPEAIEIEIEYYTAIFRESTIQRLAEHIKKLFRTVSSEPYLKLREIEIISADEKQRVLEEFNKTAVPYPSDKTIPGLYSEQTALTPDAVAMIGVSARYDAAKTPNGLETGSNAAVTYSELNLRSQQLAVQLQEQGVTTDTSVGLMCERSIEMIIALLAILKSGGAYLPINPEYPEERINYILSDSGTKIMVTPETFSLLPVLDWINRSNRSYMSYKQPCSTLAYIIYTSGTTGRPKGVMVTHRNVIRLVKNTNYIHFNQGSRLLPTGALEFDASTFEIWGALLNGLTLVLMKTGKLLEADTLKTYIRRWDISILWMTSPLFNQMVQTEIDMFAGIDDLLVGGDVLSPPHIRRLKTAYPTVRIINGYGPTENTTFSTTYLIETDPADANENIPIGKPIANSTAYIMDRDGRLQPIGLTGELCVGGDGLARGYLNNPELTSEKFIATESTERSEVIFNQKLLRGVQRGGFLEKSLSGRRRQRLYRTGDLARWQPEGNIQFLGRQDEQVKIRGYRIEPREIENLLLNHTAIKAAVVTVWEDATKEKHLCAYIVGTSGSPLSAPELKQYLAAQVPAYMIPAYFMMLERIPLTTNGKVDRRALPGPETGEGNRQVIVTPRNEIEAQLAQIWAEILGIIQEGTRSPQNRIGIDDNFFDLGGHSIKAARLIARIFTQFRVKIPLSGIFITPTIRGLAETIAHSTKTTSSHITPVETREYYELSFTQQRAWITQQKNLADNSYNIPQAIIMTAPVEETLIKKTIQAIFARHESFRTGFKEVEGKAVQFVMPQCDVPLSTLEISTLEKPQRESRLEQILGQLNREPFNLNKPPLFRALLVKVEPERYIFAYNMHHIISDGWSLEILEKEFKAIYETLSRGLELEPPKPKLTYKDFAYWNNRRLSDRTGSESREFWLRYLQEEMPVLRLPWDFDRPHKEKKGASYRFVIEATIKDALNRLSQTRQITLFALMYALYNIFLSEISGQRRVLSGIVNAGREHPLLQEIVGFFTQAVIFKIEINEDETFIDFSKRVQSTALELFQRQHYHIELVLDEAGITYPDIPASFNMLNISEKQDIPLTDTSARHDETMPNVKFDLEPFVTEYRNALEIIVTYNRNRFKPETIEYVMKRYLEIIEFFARNPQKYLREHRESKKKKSFKRKE